MYRITKYFSILRMLERGLYRPSFYGVAFLEVNGGMVLGDCGEKVKEGEIRWNEKSSSTVITSFIRSSNTSLVYCIVYIRA